MFRTSSRGVNWYVVRVRYRHTSKTSALLRGSTNRLRFAVRPVSKRDVGRKENSADPIVDRPRNGVSVYRMPSSQLHLKRVEKRQSKFRSPCTPWWYARNV